MDIRIIVFSQTGNTRKVAHAMARVLREGDHNVQTIPMKKTSPDDIADCDLIGIGCPTFECQAPTPVTQFLKSLPQIENRKVFVFATGAGAPGKVIRDLTKQVRKKGAEIVGGLWTRGIIHHPAPCLVGKSPGHPNEEDLSEARRFAVAVTCYVSNNSHGTLKKPFNSGKSKFGFYCIVGLITSYKGLVRLLLPEPKLDHNKCDKCKFCVMECPMNNIIMETYPVLGKLCIRCYRCLNGCPTKAFKANWWFGNLVCFALWNETFMRWLGDYN